MAAGVASLLGIGLLTGLASGLLGVGGGFLLVPLLSAAGVPLHATVGASLVFILGTSLSGAWRHLRQGTADWRLALPLMAASAASAVAAAATSVRLDEAVLALLFATVTAVALALFNLPPGYRAAAPAAGGPARRGWVGRRQQVGAEMLEYGFQPLRAAGVGALIGVVTGLLGIGGGFLLVPMLVAWLAIPLAVAVGTSLLSILAAATAGIAMHWSLVGLDPALVLPLVATGMLGAQLGARLVARLPARRLRALYNLLLVSATAYMLLRTALVAGG